ncbi:hypothetical protein MLD38_019267 [Melastoma candidum]|uniref:Uncharacterized protein n=1 Tax=Melastoma candidum TaxID=119954 RepID=A0ACB9R0H2_9MYRT|nr:hypothetical protein MLD38_019267 [Melastoma candidum]
MTSAFPSAASSSLLPPHATRRFPIPRSHLALTPSACCDACFRPTLLNLRGLPLSPVGLGQGGQRWTWDEKGRRKKGGFAVCSAVGPISLRNVQWISTVSSAVLMLAKGTAVQKSFLVPLLALQAPSSIISWMKGEYGAWAAFLALLVRLFFYIPGELELPFMVLLLAIVAPHQVIRLRGTQEGAIISVLIAVYLGYQHFSGTSLQRAFDQGSVVATVAVICIMAASILLVL